MAVELHYMLIMEVAHFCLLRSRCRWSKYNWCQSNSQLVIAEIDKKNPGWVRAGIKLESRGMEQEVI